jgi:Delta3-Delta2-enoyl-CoA isomerase
VALEDSVVQSIVAMEYKFLTLECKADVFIITLNKPPENRLNVAACQELIRAYRQAEAELGQDAEGAIILCGSGNRFFTTGLDLDERERNPYSSSDGFYPLLATVLDCPFVTIALINGHVFGGSCLLTLAHDYRIMNEDRGYWQMPPVNAGLHHPGMGTLPRTKLSAPVARKVLLEAHKYTAKEALADGIVDAIAPPDQMLAVAMTYAQEWKAKSKMGVYGTCSSPRLPMCGILTCTRCLTK